MDAEKLYAERLRESGLVLREIKDRAILANFREAIAKKKGRPDQPLDDLRGLVRFTIKKNPMLEESSVKAFHSSISAYAAVSLRYKDNFNYKDINLTDLV